MKFIGIILFSFFFLIGCSRICPFKESYWIDLTHDFSNETIYWPTGEHFMLETEFQGETKGGFYYSANKYSASEHGGTHIDAPIHFAKDGKTVDQISLDKLIGKAVVIDVSEKTLAEKDYLVSIKDITNWESMFGKISEDAIVLLYTGQSKYWTDVKKYLGTDKQGLEGVNELHFPGLDPEACGWLVDNRKIKAIGIDTASIDFGQSKSYECHQILLGSDIPIFENVANLDKLPTKGARIIALPMKIKGGSGGPLRIVARVKD